MTIEPWKVLESSYVRPRIRLDKCKLPNDTFLDATVFEFRAWANVLALTRDNEAVLVRQYRHGVKDVLWEIPGGVVEDGESPLDGIKRELLEETGYTASEFIPVGRLYANPAPQTNTLHCFLALNAEKVTAQALDDGEDIEVHLIPLDDLLAMTRQGDFVHALLVACVYRSLDTLGRVR